MAAASQLQSSGRASGSELDDERLKEVLADLPARWGQEAWTIFASFSAAWPCSETEVLDTAASIAARHQALEGQETRLRSLLCLITLRDELARKLGGAPRDVVDDFERMVTAGACLQGEAIRTIWAEPMLKSKDAAVALGARPTNREKIRRLREQSSIFGLPYGNGFLYPAFQFDPRKRAVFTEVRSVNEQLIAVEDPWGVASWWMSRNARLGVRPVDLVGTDRGDDLVAVARATVEPLG
ncbi:MAG: hypothetical protein OXS29_11895 [bacterium]|nr:hypothetical protein [bacterium]MDE0289059.1 hypothetical protein [bacterium]MDE0439365.1 hypothetical protein [bacterium]